MVGTVLANTRTQHRGAVRTTTTAAAHQPIRGRLCSPCA